METVKGTRFDIAKDSLGSEQAAKTIQLSENKYCSVLATLRPGVQLSSSFEVIL